MSVVGAVRSAVTGGASQWLPVGLRAVSAVILLPAGVLKLLEYGPRGARFAELGVPAPDVLVVVVGVIELLAAVALAVGVASRAGALASVLVMLGAIAFVGVAPTNAVVLAASLGVLALGPGHYAVWNPESRLVGRATERLGR